MPDYNLGRAHGEVIITADTRGAAEAATAMAGLEAESRALNHTLGEAKQVLGENDAQYVRYSNTLRQQQRHIEDLSKSYRQYQAGLDAVRMAQRAVDADLASLSPNRVNYDKERNELLSRQNRLRDEEAKLVARSERAYSQLSNATQSFHGKLDELGSLLVRHQTHLRNWEADLQRVGNAFGSLGGAISSFLAILSKSTYLTMGGTAAGGFLGLLGAGGTNLLITGIYGITQAVGQMIGAFGLIPPIVGGALASLGALKIGLQGFGEALKSMDDPEKFAEAIRKLSPAAREVANTIKGSWKEIQDSMRGVQEVLFRPIVDDIKPLINLWLPALRDGFGSVARIFGEMGHELAGFLQQPEVMQTFQAFLSEITTSLTNLRPALEPLTRAFMTLTTVGGSFLPQLAQEVTVLADKFADFVREAAASGKLQEFIQSGIDGFKSFASAIWSFGNAMHNIFEIGRAGGETFLETIARLAQQFRNWTETFSGKQAIQQFFSTIREASDTLMPILRIIGGAIANVATTLVHLGTATGPGLTNFFRSLASALANLGPHLIDAAPALNQFMTAVGGLIVDIVDSIGPALPNLFQTFADVLTNLAPILVTAAQALGGLLSHLTPKEVEALLALAAAFVTLDKGISLATKWGPVIQAAASILSNPWVAAIAGIAALVAGLIWAYNNIQWFHDGVNNVCGKIRDIFVNLWNDAKNWGHNIVQGIIDGFHAMENDLKKAANWVAELIKDPLHTHSPAKTGPLHDNSPEEMGSNIVRGVATGISEGAPLVAEASKKVAGGTTEAFLSSDPYGSFSGGGPRSGVGGSGFDSWAKAITDDLSAWLNIFKSGWDVLKDFVDIAIESVKISQNIAKDNAKWGWLGTTPAQPPGQIVGQPQAPNATEVRPADDGQGGGRLGASAYQPAPATVTVAPASETGGSGSGSGSGQTRGAPPTAKVSAPLGNSRAQLAASIFNEAKRRGYSDQAAYAAVEAANLESSLNPDIENASGHKGLFQQSKDKPLRNGPQEQMQWFFDELGRQGGTPEAVEAYPGGPRGFIADKIEIGGYPGTRYAEFADESRNLVAEGNAGGAPVTTPIAQPPATAPAPSTNASPAGNPNDMVDVVTPGGTIKAKRSIAERMVGLGTWKWPGGQAPAGSKPWSISGSAGARTEVPSLGPDRRGDLILPTGDIGETPILPKPETQDRRGAVILPTSAGPIGLATETQNAPLAINDVSGNFPNKYSRGGVKPNLFLVHTEEWTGSEKGAPGGSTPRQMMAYQQSEGKGNSYNYYIDKDTGAIFMAVPPDMAPGATRGVNERSINAVIAGSTVAWSRDQWLQHQPALQSLAYLAAKSGAPLTPLTDSSDPNAAGIGGHDWATRAGYPTDGHSDPGRNFPWDIFMGYVRQYGGVPGPEIAPLTPQATPTGQPFAPAWLDYIKGINQPPPNLSVAPTPLTPVPQPDGTYTQGNITDMYRNVPGADHGPGPAPGPGPNFYKDWYPPQKPAAGTSTPPIGAGSGNINIDQISSIVSSVGGLVNDGFNVASNVIESIGAAANLTDIMARGVENTQDIMHVIDQVQTFIKLAASISQTVADSLGLAGQITSMAGAAGGGGDGGGAAAAGAALGAAGSIAGMVTSAIGAVNSAIEFGQLIYQEVTKVGATLAGYILGGPETGPLSGNVRMLLNTNTGQILTYSEDNSQLKNTINLPKWAVHSYTPGPGLQTQSTQLNIYAGPGQSTQDMMSDSMWLISTGAASVASVAGLD